MSSTVRAHRSLASLSHPHHHLPLRTWQQPPRGAPNSTPAPAAHPPNGGWEEPLQRQTSSATALHKASKFSQSNTHPPSTVYKVCVICSLSHLQPHLPPSFPHSSIPPHLASLLFPVPSCCCLFLGCSSPFFQSLLKCHLV